MKAFATPRLVHRIIPLKPKLNLGLGHSNARFFTIPLTPSLLRSFSSKVEANQSDFTLSYLVESCGLSPEAALLASQKVHLHSSKKPDSVLALLTEYGFSKPQISNVIRKRPLFLLANPNDTLLPKLQFLRSIGMSSSDLTRILTTDATILTRSLEKQIIPSYNFLKSVLLSDEKVIAALKRTSWIVLEDHSKKLVPKLSVLREMGVPESCIALLLAHFPETLILKNEHFTNIVQEIKEMGFDPTKSMFVLAVHVMAGNKSIYNRCRSVYERLGWSEDEIVMAFRKHPNSMLLSEDKIMKTMDFLVNKMGWPSGMIAKCPAVLFYNLEKRIKPRCSVVQVLRLKGFIKKPLSLSTVLLPAEKRFLDNFVTKYEQQVPQLWSVYQMKLDFQTII